MLLKTIKDFLLYCTTCDFGVRSLKVFASILPGFNEFITNLDITSIKDISYPYLLEFVISGNTSVHAKKQRVWALHQFFHFLKLKKLVASNIATALPYPKIDKMVII